jgi:chaperone BCS1
MSLSTSKLAKLFDTGHESTSINFGLVAKDVSTIISLANKVLPNKHLNTAVTGLGIAMNVASIGQHLYRTYLIRKLGDQYRIRIAESDEAFAIAERWLEQSLTEEQTRSSFVSTRIRTISGNSIDEWSTTSSAQPRKVDLTLKFDGSFEQEIEVKGHKVKISTTVPDASENKDAKSKASAYFKDRTINLECRTLEAREAVVEALTEEVKKLAQRSPSFLTAQKWGGYRNVSDIPARDASSVILKAGQMERILEFLKRFLDNEETYNKLGVPYRTGIMLHGVPGSGKSSTATAIAYELGLNICYISLSTLDDDEALGNALTGVPARSLVVLEDVDVYRATRNREEYDDPDDAPRGITMSGLLNALDGFLAPHGTVTVMTTNHLEKLDPAITRPGRIDLTEEIDPLDTDQLERMCKTFIGYVPDGLPSHLSPQHGITSAEVLGVIRDHIPNVEESGPDIVRFVHKKLEEFTKNSV